jgi:elongator complex protein 3
MEVFSPKWSAGATIEDVRSIFHSTKSVEADMEDYAGISYDTTKITNLILELSSLNIKSRSEFDKNMVILRKKYSMCPPKPLMYRIYRSLYRSGKIPKNYNLEISLKKKLARSSSGIVSITTFMGPGAFSCPKKCAFCPEEVDETGKPTQPKSYLSTEPGCMRALKDKFHPVLQVYDRLHTLENIGHIDDDEKVQTKGEFIVSGGTFNFYPREYIEWFMTCLYYASNTYFTWSEERPMLSLEEEQTINETAQIRIIGLTIETRPDYVTPIIRKVGERISVNAFDPENHDIERDELGRPSKFNLSDIHLFRRLGITRIQVGIQHTDQRILDLVRRDCTIAQNKWGIYILKQNGFKVDIHIMTDLPGSSPEQDLEMLKEVIEDPDYSHDQIKLYPCETTPYTEIKKWFDEGRYIPYGSDANKTKEVLKYYMINCKPWVRINRVIRDIPEGSIVGGTKCSHMRSDIDEELKSEGIQSMDIRFREVAERTFNPNNIRMFVRQYQASSGTEYFISYEGITDTTIYGFIRLRLNMDNYGVLPNLYDTALIRELHVYGMSASVGTGSQEHTQHKGLGKRLIAKAEEIARENGFKRIAVISGVGVREYYRKLGYTLEDTYMIKKLPKKINEWVIIMITMIIGFIFGIQLGWLLYQFHLFTI